MRQAGEQFHITSLHIDLGLGPGVIAVIVGLN